MECDRTVEFDRWRRRYLGHAILKGELPAAFRHTRELDESQEQVTLLQQQSHQRTETLRQQQSCSAESTRKSRRKSLELDISKYRGVEKNFLMRCFVEVDGEIEDRRICSVVLVRGRQNFGSEPQVE